MFLTSYAVQNDNHLTLSHRRIKVSQSESQLTLIQRRVIERRCSCFSIKENAEQKSAYTTFRRCDTQLMLSQRGVIETLNIRNHDLSSLMPDWKKNSTGNSRASLPLKEAFWFTQIETSVFSKAFPFNLCISTVVLSCTYF